MFEKKSQMKERQKKQKECVCLNGKMQMIDFLPDRVSPEETKGGGSVARRDKRWRQRRQRPAAEEYKRQQVCRQKTQKTDEDEF